MQGVGTVSGLILVLGSALGSLAQTPPPKQRDAERH